MISDTDKIKLTEKIENDTFYQNGKSIAEKMMNCEEVLIPNLMEWIYDKELSNIWIRDKYCIRAVLKIRNSNEFVDAFLSLDAYAKDERNEFLLWQQRM